MQETDGTREPEWLAAGRRAVVWMLGTAVFGVAALVCYSLLLDGRWLDGHSVASRMRRLSLEIYGSTVLMSWLATLAALAFAFWIYSREFRRERRRRDAADGREWERRAAEMRSGSEPGVPAEHVLATLRSESNGEDHAA